MKFVCVGGGEQVHVHTIKRHATQNRNLKEWISQSILVLSVPVFMYNVMYYCCTLRNMVYCEWWSTQCHSVIFLSLSMQYYWALVTIVPGPTEGWCKFTTIDTIHYIHGSMLLYNWHYSYCYDVSLSRRSLQWYCLFTYSVQKWDWISYPV